MEIKPERLLVVSFGNRMPPALHLRIVKTGSRFELYWKLYGHFMPRSWGRLVTNKTETLLAVF